MTTNGTLMSYCHVIGCSPRNLVFHTRSIADNPADPYGIDSILTEVANASCLNSLSGGVVPAAPTITNVSPATGVLAGGTVLTITGTNFVNGATVAFVELPSNNVFGTPSSKAAASVTFNSSTQLTATTPSASSVGGGRRRRHEPRFPDGHPCERVHVHDRAPGPDRDRNQPELRLDGAAERA